MKHSSKDLSVRKVNFKVKVTQCHIHYDWYFKKIGKVYNITMEGTYHYYFKNKAGCIKPILKDDCKKLKS